MTDVKKPTPSARAPASPGHEWLEEVFREHYVELCAFVFGYVASDDAAEDIVQDLFLAIWESPDRWKETGKSPRFLLYVAARNRALDYIKFRRVRERHAENVAETPAHTPATAVENLARQEVQQALDNAIASLPERAREIFLLSREEGLTYREIAERLELSIKTVETQMSRSLKRLRSELATYLALIIAALFG
jgi:RNA polymerase sigma-70 factor (ECF subfamily)